MLEIFGKLLVVEERKPQGRQERVGVASVFVRRRVLRDAPDWAAVVNDDGLVVLVGGLLLEDLDGRLPTLHPQKNPARLDFELASIEFSLGVLSFLFFPLDLILWRENFLSQISNFAVNSNLKFLSFHLLQYKE